MILFDHNNDNPDKSDRIPGLINTERLGREKNKATTTIYSVSTVLHTKKMSPNVSSLCVNCKHTFKAFLERIQLGSVAMKQEIIVLQPFWQRVMGGQFPALE